LDSDPLNRHSRVATPCRSGEENGVGWELREIDTWVDPGWLTRALMVSALPVFVITAMIVSVLGRLEINQVWRFMVSMPLLILAWFYRIGSPIDP
jgi:hypothetical protein